MKKITTAAKLLMAAPLITSLFITTGCSSTNNTAASALQSVDISAQQYVKLVLALGQHDSGYVDAYYGPEQWAKQAEQTPSNKQLIISEATALKTMLPKLNTLSDEMDRLRVHFLQKQLDALIAHAKALTGNKKLSFDEQSQVLYDTQAPHHNLTDFDDTLAQFEQLMPGDGPLHLRIEKFKAQFEIPEDKLAVVFARAIKECRERTKPWANLLAHEDFTLEYVKDKPWGGYNWYKGNAKSLIQVNTDFPTTISRAVDLGCHEGYPGHHTYNAMLEDKLVKQRGWVEFTVYPLYSPQSLIAEGSANYGIEMAFPGNDKIEFEKNVLYPLAGIDPALADSLEHFSQLNNKLGYAGNEIARLYINGDIDKEKTIALLQKYSMNTRKKAEHRISFIDTYGAYVINYNWGKDMVKNYVEQAQGQQQRWQRFIQLLSSPRLPSSLGEF